MEEQITRLNERVKVKLAPSPIHGVGVFAIRYISKGQRVYADSVPEVFSVSYGNFSKLFPEVRELLLGRFPQVVNGANFVFPTDRVLGYMNHSDDPNYSVETDCLLRDVKVGEEITEDYRLVANYEKVYPFLSTTVA